MPITSPSEFPPHKGNGTVTGLQAGRNTTGANCFFSGLEAGNNSTVDNLIAIGANVLSAGVTDADLVGTVVIGNDSCEELVAHSLNPGAVTVVGYKNLGVVTEADNFVCVGANNFNYASAVSINDSVIIGNNNANDLAGLLSSVYIGEGISSTATAGGQPGDNVAIGFNAAEALSGGGQNVVIGSGAGGPLSDGAQNVIIGYQAEAGLNAGDNIVIGATAAVQDSSARNIVIGFGATYDFGSQANTNAVVIGYNASSSDANGYCISLNGADAIRGQFGAGIVFGTNGFSRGSNYNLAGQSNTVAIMNGTPASSLNPTGGGYFYVSAGALHWVGSSGTDTTLAPA